MGFLHCSIRLYVLRENLRSTNNVRKGGFPVNMMQMMLMRMYLLAAGTGGTGGSTWSISGLLKAFRQSVTGYVQIIIVAIGVVMVGVGVYQIAKNLISHGKGQTNWVVTAALIMVGGMLMLSGGWTVLEDIGTGSKNTLDNMGKGDADGGYISGGDDIKR